MSVVINGTTGITAAAFDGAVDGADLTGTVAASLLTGDVAAARITGALNATGSAPIYACRAWVNFNGTGTVAIRASGNVSSITDNGTGKYTVNFTTAMPDENYATVGTCSLDEAAILTNIVNYSVSARATSSVSIVCGYQSDSVNAGIIADCSQVSVAIFR